jgi:hypothetical protein
MNESGSPADTQTVPTRVMLLDTEHGGVRLLLIVLTVIGFLAGYALTTSLVAALKLDVATGCLAFIAGFVAAMALALAGERLLKRLWPSGRTLTLAPDGLRYQNRCKKDEREICFDWDRRINLLAWRFSVARGSARAPKGWIVLGLQLLQDESQLSLYTLMPPKEATALPDYEIFILLMSRAAIEKGGISLRELGEQRRLLGAEDARWRNGAEVRREDFPSLIAAITRHVPADQINA